jgi:hypothetical protein
VLRRVSSIVANDRYRAAQREPLDAHFYHIDDACKTEHGLGVAAGIGFAIVVTHDC